MVDVLLTKACRSFCKHEAGKRDSRSCTKAPAKAKDFVFKGNYIFVCRLDDSQFISTSRDTN